MSEIWLSSFGRDILIKNVFKLLFFFSKVNITWLSVKWY